LARWACIRMLLINSVIIAILTVVQGVLCLARRKGARSLVQAPPCLTAELAGVAAP
jgi:hypothetical protein